MTINHGEHMQSYYIMQLAFHDSFLSTKPSQPYSYTYGDRPVFEFSFLPNEIAEGDTLVYAVDNDMVFYDNAPENLLHSASCMVVVRHDVTAEEATAGKVQLRIETRTVKFRDVTNGKVRPVEVISGLYRRRGSGDDLNYVLLAKGRAFANGIIADYDALPEPITIDEYYTKGDIDGLLGEKADAATLVAHTDNADIHVTLQDKTTWDSKADIGDIGNATVTITQGGETKGSFSVNASENVTIEVNDGAQADWNETDTSSPSYIQHKPSVYTKTETDALLNEKADKASVYTKGETDGLLDAKANVATTLSGYGIQDAYTKTETDGLLNEKANVATTYTKDETDGLLDAKADKASTYTKTETDALLDAKADKATTIAGYGITDAYTKTEVDAKVTSVYRYKGTVSTYADLPSSGQEVGDVWNIETADSAHGIKAGDNVAWNGATWDALAGTVDLTPYATKDELSAGLADKSDIDHLHTGKYVELTEDGHIKSGYVVAGIMTAGGAFNSNGYVNALLGYKKNNVSLDDIYAAKSELATVATTGDYNDLTNKPDLTTKLDAPAVAGTVGQVLTKTADGQEWADAPAGGGGDVPDATDYLCFMAEQANSTVRLDKVGSPDAINLEYSTDKKTWTEYTWDGNNGVAITLANVGDSVYFRGNNSTFSTSSSNCYTFNFSTSTRASGNIMSLIDKSCKSVKTPNAYCFYHLFYNCTSLTKAPELPATTLSYNCYNGMFYGCTSLIEAPYLPATTLVDDCYRNMFRSCTSLRNIVFLPATYIQRYSYYWMFYGCTSLTSVIINATSGYRDVGQNMFGNCTSLKHVKAMFTNWKFSNFEAFYAWLSGASSTGVFECPSALDCSTRDDSHVPAGWTIVRTDAPKSITSPTTASSEATYQVSPNAPDVPVVTVASALTLNAKAIDSGSITYAEIVLDVASGATVTAGTNLTLVDEITAGKRNICVVRWSGGTAKLYVTIVEDLPQA